MEMADRLRFVLLLLPVSLPVVCRLGLCWRRGVMTGIIVMCGAELYLRDGSHEEFRWKTFAYHRCVSPSVLSCPTVVYHTWISKVGPSSSCRTKTHRRGMSNSQLEMNVLFLCLHYILNIPRNSSVSHFFGKGFCGFHSSWECVCFESS